ncbi:MAG: hypothetical protein ACK4IS_05215 [Erythrobacter sp.]
MLQAVLTIACRLRLLARQDDLMPVWLLIQAVPSGSSGLAVQVMR